ncbi:MULTISPECIES: hypothetical protein [unclassified Caballeronia]|uniref:hypothetical protein n=1 Tax=unclassified Caballeronia TaxID=2646786 RepID=UPI002862E46D|nr:MULTISPECIES: hypothetical protein [unclassified Caballeronia]MDR5772901.1 hypothetical protein [Caballeronia sp. LZ002]MDR5803636.1 hypothetical protein [Caballeronia sp. LZ001]MDR5848335.1 hypothetical protein [Caballeronia sp. LZ003]
MYVVSTVSIDDAFANGLRISPPHFQPSLSAYLTGAPDSGFIEALKTYGEAVMLARALARENNATFFVYQVNGTTDFRSLGASIAQHLTDHRERFLSNGTYQGYANDLYILGALEGIYRRYITSRYVQSEDIVSGTEISPDSDVSWSNTRWRARGSGPSSSGIAFDPPDEVSILFYVNLPLRFTQFPPTFYCANILHGQYGYLSEVLCGNTGATQILLCLDL